MCTAISYNRNGNYYIRTLDLECSFDEKVVIAPRAFPFEFLHTENKTDHVALLGMAHVYNGVPLFYDAVNENGLYAAGLNFPNNAVYHGCREGMNNIASFEFIPWLLCSCETVADAQSLLKKTNVTNDSVGEKMPATSMHWLIADKRESIVAEPLAEGLKIYENPVGVLTNNPTLEYHITNLSNYMSLSSEPPENTLCPNITLSHYSRGLGAVGMPGDFSSASRFVRAAFVKEHINTECDIGGLFHIAGAVSVPKDCVITERGEGVSTVYTSVADGKNLVYYFTTEKNRRIRAVSMKKADVYGADLTSFSIYTAEDILYIN